MSRLKTIIFTGGGSGGHVMPALTLIKKLQSNYEIQYIGDKKGIEAKLAFENELDFQAIKTGKLRRYFSFKNLTDIFNIIIGTFQSYFYLLKFKKNESIVFSTGGFVTVPVVVAAFFQGKKIIIHEQTSCVGLANKIASLFASKVLISFEDSKKYFPQEKTFYSGYPLRDELFEDDANRSVEINGKSLSNLEKPILFITGGGNGAKLLNDHIKNNIEVLKKDYFIIHQVGAQFEEEFKSLNDNQYFSTAFLGKEMIDIMKMADVIISRSGAGTVCELIALGKPSIFIPLKIAQKNEQYHNAKEAEKRIGSIIIEEDNLNDQSLLEAIEKVREIKKGSVQKNNSTEEIISTIRNFF